MLQSFWHNKYIRGFVKFSAAFFILVVGFIVFYSLITADDPSAGFSIDDMIDNTADWIDFNRYKPKLGNLAFFDVIEVEYVGDTTRLNFDPEKYPKYYVETRYDKYLKDWPYVDQQKWMIPEEEEYRRLRRRQIGCDPDDALPDEKGKIRVLFKTWRVTDRTVYYIFRFEVGTEADPLVYSDFRVGNTKRYLLIEIFERNMDMMMKLFAKKFYYMKGMPDKAPKVEKI